MNWFSGLLVFVIIWWVVIFAVLPWGVRVPDQVEPGHAPSAPAKPMLLRKFLITTVITSVIWLGVYYVIDNGLIDFREMARDL